MPLCFKGRKLKQKPWRRTSGLPFFHTQQTKYLRVDNNPMGDPQPPLQVAPPPGEDIPDGLLPDDNSIDSPPGSTIKWHIGNSTVDRDFVQFVTVYILIFIIAITSLANLTVKEERTELWASLLSMMCGIVVPQPRYKKKGDHNKE